MNNKFIQINSYGGRIGNINWTNGNFGFPGKFWLSNTWGQLFTIEKIIVAPKLRKLNGKYSLKVLPTIKSIINEENQYAVKDEIDMTTINNYFE